MKIEELPDHVQEDIGNLRYGSATIEADVEESIEQASTHEEFCERVNEKMDTLIEEAKGIKQEFHSANAEEKAKEKKKTPFTLDKNAESGLANIIVVGQCKGTYKNHAVTKEFEARVLASARPDGTVIVHDLTDGVRPICYIDGGAEISLARNMADAELEFFATTEDGQQLTLTFTEVTTIQGIPRSTQHDSLALSVIQCVFDMGGKYGRTTIARVLTGSVSKKILTINLSKLGTYGIASDASMKEVLALLDWLIEENYLAYVEDSEFPLLVVTAKGLDILANDGKVPAEAKVTDENIQMNKEEIDRRRESLKEWSDKSSAPKP